MIHILINAYNFDQPWAFSEIAAYLKPHMKTLIVPLSHNEEYSSDAQLWHDRYDTGMEWHENIVRPFKAFQIDDRDIAWLNYYEDDAARAGEKVRKADVIVLAGVDAEETMERIEDLELTEALRSFDGILIGVSAGALVQLRDYHQIETEERDFGYGQGLGLIDGLDIDVHYREDIPHLNAVIRSIEDFGRPVVCFGEQGGMIIDRGHVELLGRAFAADTGDLDDLYRALEDAKNPYLWE